MKDKIETDRYKEQTDGCHMGGGVRGLSKKCGGIKKHKLVVMKRHRA